MNNIGEFVILRSQDDGVKCGWLVAITMQPGGLACAVLRDARQIHGWQQNNENYTLLELANNGVIPPATARISAASELPVTMFGVCGAIPCTERAIENLTQSRWNQPFAYSGLAQSPKRQRG